MITPFLNSRHGWSERRFLHPSLIPALEETEGVVVFHEQVLLIVAETTGVTLAQADEVRRSMGTPQGQTDVEAWWRPAAKARGYSADDRDRIWEVLKSFASFGFCKAHAAAFALPTFHSAWLKTHHPAAFLSGILTHDPGMYPKRLLLDDARSFGIPVLGLDVNASREVYRIERVDEPDAGARHLPGAPPARPRPRGRRRPRPGCRAAGLAARPPAVRHPALARRRQGDQRGRGGPGRRRAALRRPRRLLDPRPGEPPGHRAARARRGVRHACTAWVAAGWGGAAGSPGATCCCTSPSSSGGSAGAGRRRAAAGGSPSRASRRRARWRGSGSTSRERAAAQSQAAREVVPAAEQPTQLTLDLGDRPQLGAGAGLPEMTGPERVRAELDVLGLDVSAHVVEFYAPLLRALGVTRSRDLLGARSRSEVWVAGVKVATQTPPVRSGRRVVFLTLDDSTGPADCTFFEDVQGPYADVVFHSWLLLVRGVLRRTGDRGVSIRATGAWELAGALGRLAARRPRAGAGGDHRGGGRCRGPRRGRRGRRPRARRPHRSPGARARLGVSQSPYADTRPPGVDPRSGRGAAAWARPPARCPRASCGTPAPAAPDTRVVTPTPTVRHRT